MASIEKIIPFLVFWEAGVMASGLSNEELYLKAKAKGLASDPADSGGATLVGVTIGTYKDYCRRKGMSVPFATAIVRSRIHI